MNKFLDKLTYHKVTKILTIAVYPAGLLGMSVFAFDVGPFHIFPYRILLPIIWVMVIARVINNKGSLFNTPLKVKTFGIFLLIWLVYSIVSIIWAMDKTDAIIHVIYLFLSFSLILFSVVFFDSIEDLYIVSSIWLVFLGLVIILGIIETITGFHLPVSRYYQISKLIPTGVFYNQNDLATFLSLSTPFLLSYFLFTKKTIYRLIFLASFLALLYVMISTGSRANFLALILELGYFTIVFFTLQTNRKEIYLLLSSFVLVFLIFPKLVADKFTAVMFNLQSIVKQFSTQTYSIGHRMSLARNGLLFLISTWGFGVGAGNLEHWMMTRAHYEIERSYNIHNWFLEVLVNYGVLIFFGYVAFLAGMIYWIYHMLRTHKDDHKMKVIGVGILGSLIGFMVASISSSSIVAFKPHWMIYAIGLSYINIGLNTTHREGQDIQVSISIPDGC